MPLLILPSRGIRLLCATWTMKWQELWMRSGCRRLPRSSETAFLTRVATTFGSDSNGVPTNPRFDLRWFTPVSEVTFATSQFSWNMLLSACMCTASLWCPIQLYAVSFSYPYIAQVITRGSLVLCSPDFNSIDPFILEQEKFDMGSQRMIFS